jgi:diguanylate cyclase (GGDEF)-like protein/PAS domain S-box-containing protein
MHGSYDLSIVALSVAVAIIASYTALDMAGRVSASDSSPRKSWMWLVAGAVSMGTGIWSMHFIGMLSFHLPIQVAFDLPITLLSLIIAIVASVIALFFLRQAQLGIRNLIISTILMGTGIVAMHYTGMFAMQMSPPIRYDPLLFVASVLIAIVASFAALWISFQLRWKHSRLEILAKLGSAGVMGLAISGMHYTGMAAAHFAPGSVCLAVTSGGIDSVTLAIGVGGVSLGIMSFTLIVSALDANFGKKFASANRQLHESEEKLVSILATTDNVIWSINADTYETLYLNPAAERIYGRSASAFYADPTLFMNIVHPEDRPRVAQMLPELIEKGAMTIQYRVVRPDGEVRWLEDRPAIVRDADGRLVRFNGLASDITKRKRLTAATEYRGKLLNAVSIAAKELLTAATIKDAMAKVLQTIGEAVRADRILVLENRDRIGMGPLSIMRYSWNSAAAPALSSLGQIDPSALETDPWFAPLFEGKAVTCVPSVMPDGVVKTMLQRLGIASSLDVPIIIDGKYWGRICLDECTTAREWSPAEVDILRTAADMIGSAIIREHYVAELRDANMIIERSPTILFRLRGEPSLPLIYVSHNVTMFGYDPAEMIASPQLYKTIIHPDDELKILELLERIVMEGTQSETVEFRMRTSDGIYRWVENHYTPIRDAAGRLVEIEGVLTDVTEKKEAADKIMVLARTDALTGLANRATFIDRLRQSFAAAKRGANPFAVLYLDLDRFKDVNDTLGHGAGDLLLKAVAKRLKSSTRETDLVARLGGDEFAILQSDLIDVANAGALASKIHDVLAAPYPLGESEMHIGVSIGISPYMSETEGSDEMLTQADLALYRAKEEGRDQYCFHSADLDREVRDRVAITNDLRLAIERSELELYYQPQVELATGLIVGMEALIRWNHPSRGLLKPGDFLPIVEKTPLIVTFGQWVLDHACEQMNTWQKAGIAPPILAINLSLKQLRTGDKLVGSITQTLTKWGLSPKDLELDVTESMLADVTLHNNSVLDRLQQLGVKIAIDDFGTQYSSLDYLKTYRVSRVKIPRLMIDASTQDPEASAMVRAIIGVARELGIEVIAQGVETEAQRNLLSSVPSTTKVQGFYYSAPVRTGDATEMLRQRLIEPRLSQISEATAAQ